MIPKNKLFWQRKGSSDGDDDDDDDDAATFLTWRVPVFCDMMHCWASGSHLFKGMSCHHSQESGMGTTCPATQSEM